MTRNANGPAGPAIFSSALYIGSLRARFTGQFHEKPWGGQKGAALRLHSEAYSIGAEEAATTRGARRLVMVGTTSVRTIETALAHGPLEAQQGETDIFIYPGFEFRGTGALLTNFHLPRTSLLLLVCAFAGTDLTLAAYRHAVAER